MQDKGSKYNTIIQLYSYNYNILICNINITVLIGVFEIVERGTESRVPG